MTPAQHVAGLLGPHLASAYGDVLPEPPAVAVMQAARILYPHLTAGFLDEATGGTVPGTVAALAELEGAR